MTFKIRAARPDEFNEIGKLMVEVYSSLKGFPRPDEQPEYYNRLANIGEWTTKPDTELLVAVAAEGRIAGAVVFFGDMKYYGSGGIAPREKNAAGFRLLAVSPSFRRNGLGLQLSEECIRRAEQLGKSEVIIHSTKAMEIAWRMYETIGFKRSPDLDFHQGDLAVYGFRLGLL